MLEFVLMLLESHDILRLMGIQVQWSDKGNAWQVNEYSYIQTENLSENFWLYVEVNWM